MTDEEFKALRATMPWSEAVFTNGRHTVIQIRDNSGAEVPLLTLVKFNLYISRQLAAKEKA